MYMQKCLLLCKLIDRVDPPNILRRKGEGGGRRGGCAENFSKKGKFIEREQLNILRLLRNIFLKQIHNNLIGLVFLSTKRITRYMYINAYWDMLVSIRGDEEKKE